RAPHVQPGRRRGQGRRLCHLYHRRRPVRRREAPRPGRGGGPHGRLGHAARRRARRGFGLGLDRCLGGFERRQRWPTIEASAPRPQRRTAPFRRQDRVSLGGIVIRLAMYAIVKTGGKQYRVEEGQSLLVERLPVDDGGKATLEPLLYVDGSNVVDGEELAKVSVEARVVGHPRGPKLR